MVAADMVELREVVSLCTRYLSRELEPGNAIGILRFARDHNCADLTLESTRFVHDRFAEVCQGEEFRDAPREIVVEFLASECLRVDSEYQVRFSSSIGKGRKLSLLLLLLLLQQQQ